MHIAVLFINLGSYHRARLRAAHAACCSRGWDLTAVQSVAQMAQYPWGRLGDAARLPTVTVVPGEHGRPVDAIGGSREAAARMGTTLDDLRPDAVAIAGWGYPEMRAALRWCRRRDVPAVLFSETQSDDTRRFWWKEQIKARLYLRSFRAALVGGRRHALYLEQLGFPPERIFLGYDVVDNDYFADAADRARRDPAAARARTQGIPDAPYFLASSRLIARKNVLGLTRAYLRYRKEVGPSAAWDLVVCGSGEQEGAIRTLVSRRGAQAYVHLPGFVPYESLGDWYGLAAGFVHPALAEAWGLVVNEACASGLAVLSSAPTGARYELVREGINGYIFDPGSEDAMAGALLRLHELSPEERAQMGSASRAIVADFGPGRFAGGLLRAVETAARGRGAAA